VWCDELPDPDTVTTFADMRTPAGYPYKTCPFRRKVKEGKYVCRIHETKPELCKDFTPWVDGWVSQGESYNWCEAVKSK
jgi:Fe-S-cluster containining protein